MRDGLGGKRGYHLTMPVEDYRPESCFGRDGIVDRVILEALAGKPTHRGLFLQGPANRGKSWVICRLRDKLMDAVALAALLSNTPVPPPPPVVVCLFTHDSGRQAGSFDSLWLVAEVWESLRRYRPGLLWPGNLAPGADKKEAIQALYDLFVQDGRGTAALIAVLDEELKKGGATVSLVLLVDGLDEFRELRRFEREFLEPLARSDEVLVIASRRSNVRGASWDTFLLRRITREQPIDLDQLDPTAARRQLDSYFSEQQSQLQFDDLEPLFNHYAWQNPGANRRFADDAIANDQQRTPRLIMRENVERCVLELSRSARHPQPIAHQDLDWLVTVVRAVSHIGSAGEAPHKLKVILGASDKECNDWLGRLQERGIVMLQKSGKCLVHEEFASLCRE